MTFYGFYHGIHHHETAHLGEYVLPFPIILYPISLFLFKKITAGLLFFKGSLVATCECQKHWVCSQPACSERGWKSGQYPWYLSICWTGLCLVTSKWATDDPSPIKCRANEQQGRGLNTNLFFKMTYTASYHPTWETPQKFPSIFPPRYWMCHRHSSADEVKGEWHILRGPWYIGGKFIPGSPSWLFVEWFGKTTLF